MTSHHKPTKEELEAKIKKAQAKIDADDLKNNPPEPTPSPAATSPSEPPAPTPSPSVPDSEPSISPSEHIPSASPSPSTPEQPTPSPSVPPSEPEPTPSPDYKPKFVASTREAQVLASKNKKLVDVIDQAADLPAPTDDEMRIEYPDWDLMEDSAKKTARESVWNKKKFEAIHQVTKDFKNVDEWNGKVDAFVDDPKTIINNPDLEGREEEFKIFATKPSRRGVDFEDLVSAFLYKREKKKPAPKKNQMFPTGSGGPNDRGKPKGDKITTDEARVLRNTDYKKYKQYLKAGKILPPEV